MNFQPASHANDPASSREAEQRVTENGKRAKHALIVLGLVRRFPGYTAVELTREQGPGGLERHEVSRRLSDLRNAGMVREGATRPCRVAGTNQTTWYEAGVDCQKMLF